MARKSGFTTKLILLGLVVPFTMAFNACAAKAITATPATPSPATAAGTTSSSALPSGSSTPKSDGKQKPGSTVTSQVIEGITYYTGGIPDNFPAGTVLPAGDIALMMFIEESNDWSVYVTADPSTFYDQLRSVHAQLGANGFYSWVWGQGLQPMSTLTLSEDSEGFDAITELWTYNIFTTDIDGLGPGFSVTIAPTEPGEFTPGE